MYIAYRCRRCGVVFAIPTEDVEKMEKQGRYIACNFGHKEIEVLDRYDSIKECMSHSSYKRERGSIKQIK